MIYAMVPGSALVINLIINWELFKKYGFSIKGNDEKKWVHVRYNYFVLAACGYFLVDMTWGILYEHKEVQAFFPIIYFLTVLYFLFMLLTMLTWTRYIVAYLDRKGLRNDILLYGVWSMFTIGLVFLLLNPFHHLMFFYNEANEYVGEKGKNITFFLQIAFYTVVYIYMLYVAHKSTGRQKIRYKTVAVTSVVLGISLTLQILFALHPSYALGLIFGICLVHSFVQSSEKKEKEIHDHIASTMAKDYEAIFYIDIESGEYLTFAKSEKYMSINATALEKDFFQEAYDSIDECVFPEDKEYAKAFYNKETMLRNLEGKRSFSFKYRVMVYEKPRFFLFTVMHDTSSKHLIFYEKDIDDELNAEKINKENQKKTITFGQIAESLASNYDAIYYVDIANSSYVNYMVSNIFGELEITKSGDDFFKESIENIPKIIHHQDRDAVCDFLNKDNLISLLDNQKDTSIDYRIIVNGKPRFTRMVVRKTSDSTHFIVGVEDVDAEVKKQMQQLRALKTEKELARRDELTGVKNKTAYKELEESAQGNIDHGMDYLNFGLVVCDTNNLKQINDTLGHAAGDEYIRASARLLCDIFVHSPVFRVGGDEFVVFLRGNDYTQRHELMNQLHSQVLENKRIGAGVILAAGMSEYKPETDCFVSDVFERADKEMYEDKQRLKA
ncbi:diguanylate cyclase (GGDEF) domain-containing protein [Pseudobutyrivibrio sp. AR14]|uniref:GGDEF domain-containing protein n=1 Tax=Pseudobutyrivibrio sp. AR14 TaxID=1520804 RepID=UPI0008809A9C|nr:GGDEF domain-containing protein [Pseudobutyrivibrio sp. AR14]SCY14251.1 diguanylate cyclase (GGDEF) domain-containing protein [Pseudobutyrivibrio sp. AR14]